MSWPTFDPGFSTDGLTAIYAPDSTVAAILEFEAALALALADVGMAPREEAEAVADACGHGVTDPESILASTWEEGTPIIALRDRVARVIGSDAAKWFHFGATTQDAIDTGQMIQARTALGVIGQDLDSIARRMRELTVEHRDRPQMGRTFLQDAAPTTFGFRTATWLDAVLGHISDLEDQRARLAVQLGGPVGTGDAYGDRGVLEALAERLGLVAPDISWHTNRSRIISLAQTVERTSVSMGKVGADLALLASSPIGEISVRSGGSSSIPGKQNPIDATRAVAAASACTGALAMITGAPPHELDRAVGSWHAEWVGLPLAMQTAGAAVAAVRSGLGSLHVHTEAMVSGEVGSSHIAQIEKVLERCERMLGV